MKNFLKILLLGIFAFVAFPSVAQPPPPHHLDQGPITPQILYGQSERLIWTVSNHTDCDFTYDLYVSLANDKHEIVHSQPMGENTLNGGNNYSYEYDFTSIFSGNGYYELSNISMTVYIQGNPYYVYPNTSGHPTTIICTACDQPCNCFKVDFNQTTKTIDINPC